MKDWKKPFDILELESHVDERGFLFEVIRFDDFNIPSGGQVYTFSIEPSKRRGDHYHLKKEEWFTCVHGKAIILLSSLSGEEKIIEIDSEKPVLVYAGVGTSHALINKTNEIAIIVSYGSKQHDPEDIDTYRMVACKDTYKF